MGHRRHLGKVDGKSFLRGALERLCEGLELDVSLRSTVEYLQRFAPIEQAHVLMVAARTNELEVFSSTSENARKDAPSQLDCPEAVLSFLGRYEASTLHVVNARASSPTGDLISLGLFRVGSSLLILKLSARSFVLFTAQPRSAFTKGHAALLTGLRAPLAFALSNAVRNRALRKEKAALERENQRLRQEMLTLQSSPAPPRRARSVTAEAIRGDLLLDDVITKHIQQVLEAADGQVAGKGGAAEQLGVNPSTLRKRMRKLGIAHGRKLRRRTRSQRGMQLVVHRPQDTSTLQASNIGDVA